MNDPALSRIPKTCGVWKKLKPIDSDRGLRALLEDYLDEATKRRAEDWDQALLASSAERRKLIEEGKAPLLPGEDYTPYPSGLFAFGHVASTLNETGVSPAFAPAQEVISRLADWWVRDRADNAIKGHHVVASFDDRIASELHRRRYPVDAMLLALVHQTLSQYAARFYPGQTLGWLAGCHHDRAHPHVHAAIHPTTSDGTLIRFSGLKDGELGEDKFEFLRKTFNTRARQLFIDLTQQEEPKEELSLAARQLMLLSRHAVTRADPKTPDAFQKAFSVVNEWAGERDFKAVVSEAFRAAEEDFHLTPRRIADPTYIRDYFGKVHDSWEQSWAAHLDAAMGAFRAIAENRNSPDSYAPIRTTFTRPTVPMESEYEALAARNAGAPIGSPAEAIEARLATSGRISGKEGTALEAYRVSLEKSHQDLDEVQVKAAYSASQIAFYSALSFGVPLSFTEVGLALGEPVPRMILPAAKLEALAERELAAMASEEAAAHQPADPAATPGLLASSHSPRFRDLMVPSFRPPEHAPTI